MLLTSREVTERGIVVDAVPGVARATTFDATVGYIACCGSLIQSESHILPPRGIVWVISKERFRLPDDVTGLATLRTTWTHSGVLALNVGIIDPGHEGLLSTAVVNFSKSDFAINKGDAFFRIRFESHEVTNSPKNIISEKDYIRRTLEQSRLFSKTFLNMDTIAGEVSDIVLKLPRWAYILSFIGIMLAVFAIFIPIAINVWSDSRINSAKLESILREIDNIKRSDKNMPLSEQEGDKKLSLDNQIFQSEP